MPPKETAEQKLLKLIENPQGASGGKTAVNQSVAKEVAAAVKSSGLSAVSLPNFLNPILDLLKGRPPAVAFGIKEVNKALLVVCILVVSVFFFTFFKGMKLTGSKISLSLDSANISRQAAASLAPAKEISQYLESLSKRNIFQPYEKKETTGEITVAAEMSNIAALAKNYKLVGISWLDSAESASAMIEDTQSGVTYFVKQGESVSNLVVKAIYADRVILSYQGEDLTMKL